MSHLRLRLCVVIGALVALVGSANAFAAGNLVISQVYGGGGNADPGMFIINVESGQLTRVPRPAPSSSGEEAPATPGGGGGGFGGGGSRG